MMSSKKSWFDAARKRNPVIYRNRLISYDGANYRVADISDGGHVLIRAQHYIHVTDAQPPLTWYAKRNRRDIMKALHEMDIDNMTPEQALIELKAFDTLLKKEREEMAGER